MSTRHTIESYFDKLKHGSDWESLLADDMAFISYTSPVRKLQTKATFLSGTKGFYDSIRSMEVGHVLVDGARALVTTRYELQRPGAAAFRSDVAELFEVRDGKITEFAIYFDSAPFPK